MLFDIIQHKEKLGNKGERRDPCRSKVLESMKEYEMQGNE